MALKLDTITEKEWHTRKKDAGIASSGVFAKAETKNNIGPAITAYRTARKNLQRKFDAGHVMTYRKCLAKLDDSITKLVGGEGVNGNRDLSSPKGVQLKKELEALRLEIQQERKEHDAKLKDFDKLYAEGNRDHLKNVYDSLGL